MTPIQKLEALHLKLGSWGNVGKVLARKPHWARRKVSERITRYSQDDLTLIDSAFVSECGNLKGKNPLHTELLKLESNYGLSDDDFMRELQVSRQWLVLCRTDSQFDPRLSEAKRLYALQYVLRQEIPL